MPRRNVEKKRTSRIRSCCFSNWICQFQTRRNSFTKSR